MTEQQRAPLDQVITFLRWLHNDQAGYIEIVAGETDPLDPSKIRLLMPTRDRPDIPNTRKWFYLDPERPDLYNAAGDYAAQLAEQHGNVYTGIRQYRTKQRSEANVKPGRVIFIDEAPARPDLPYSASIRTSAQRRHGYYKCDQNVTKDDTRRAAAALGGDPSGVDLTQLVRIPGTFNTKRGDMWPVVSESTPGTIYKLDELRERWPAAGSGPRMIGTSWGEAYHAENWQNLPNGGPLWDSAYITAAAKRRRDLAKLRRGERVTLIKKDDTRDDSDSAQVAALAYNLLSADVCKTQARAIADFLYPQLRPGRTREHYRAHFDAELERYTPKHYRPQTIRSLGPTNETTPQPLPPAEYKPEPKSRARKDRPQRVSGPDGYLAWLRTQVDPQSDSVMLSQSQCAERLGCCIRTIKRYEKALGTRIERRVFARRQAGCLFILAPDVVTTLPVDVVIADTDVAQPDAENAQAASTHVEHSRPLVTLPPDAEPAALPALVDAIRWAIVAMEQQAVNLETGEIWRGRANPDRVRGWIAEHYPTLETVELETLYPQVRKRMQVEAAARQKRDFWNGERQRVRALTDEQLIAALWGCASRMQAAECKRPGSPWAKRCAALFAIHDDERRRRGLAAGDGPPPAKDRPSRKAAKARMQALASAVNASPAQHADDIGPAQLGFVNVAEDTTWMREVESNQAKRRRSTAARSEAERTRAALARECSSQSPPAAAGPAPGIVERLQLLKAQRQAAAR